MLIIAHCTTSCGTSLEVFENPSCTIDPPSAAICEGDSAEFCVIPADGTPPYTYDWGGGITDSCRWLKVDDTYSVVVTDAKGCTTSCQATLTVNDQPECSIDGDSVVCIGFTTEFCATAGMASYSWSGPPGFVDPGTQCTGQIGIGGLYTVTITDANGCVNTCGRTLVVNDQPACDITGDSVICEGFTTEFCAPAGMASYSWSGPGGFSANTECTGQIGVAGYYEVIITDDDGCADTCSRTLVVYDQPACDIVGGDGEVCVDSIENWCAKPDGMKSYAWTGPAGFTSNDQCVDVGAGLAPGTYFYEVTVTDFNDCAETCGRYLTVDTCGVCCPSIWIGTVDCVNPGEYATVPIYMECTPAFGGFELEVEFDYTSMTFVGADRGNLIPEGDFEKFTYRLLPCPACGCCKYKILLFGMYDLPDDHVGVPIPEITGRDTLVFLNFVVNSDENLRGLMIPICWEWEGTIDPGTGCLVEDWNCGENTFSSVSGDTLYTSVLCCQFVDSLCDDPTDRIAPVMNFQPDTICAPDCYNICGGIVVCPAGPGVCKRGDINDNDVAYEVADAVLFASYFVNGISVFIHDVDAQVCATDVNADGRALTLSDLVYLIRVILQDAVEIPKLAPSSDVVNVVVYNNSITTECASPIGAILFEFDGAVVPTLLTNMEMVAGANKVLLWSREGYAIEAATEVLSFAGAELVNVSAVDRDSRELSTTITAKVAPTAFALNPAYPNPFNPFTNLSFTLPEAANYSLNIYNVAGQLVRSYDGMGVAGLNVVSWDAKDNAGVEVASGIYFYKLTAGSLTATKKMVMLK